jgi:peptide/nickel transport system permease protein
MEHAEATNRLRMAVHTVHSRHTYVWLRSALVLLRRDRVALVGLTVIGCTILAAVCAPVLSPADPIHNSLLDRLTPPMWAAGGTPRYPLGTDTLGRDVLTRLLYGARVSLIVGLSAVVISGLLGVMLGLVSGYYGGRVDDVLMRLGDIQLAFPVLVLAIAILAVLGASLVNVILVLGLSGWVTYARIVRGETLSLKQREFIAAAHGIGAPDHIILWRHILPNVLPPVTVVATFSVARLIIAEASLSFLGLGIPPPTPSWGAMLDEGRNYITTGWWLAMFPGLAILLLVLGINLVGDWLRDVLDPRMERGM